MSQLCKAASEGSVSMCRRLLAAGSDVEEKNKNGAGRSMQPTLDTLRCVNCCWRKAKLILRRQHQMETQH